MKLKLTAQKISALVLLCCFHTWAAGQDCQLKIPADSRFEDLSKALTQTNPCILAPGIQAQSIAQVWKTFLNHGKTGGKRFDNPPRGIPSGTVLVRAEGLTFDLQDKVAEGLTRLNLFMGDVKVLEIRNPPSMVVVPASKLTPGASYRWQLLTQRDDYWGIMKVLDAGSQAVLQQRLTQLAATDASTEIKNVYVAAIYDDADLIFDRDRLFTDMKKQK